MASDSIDSMDLSEEEEEVEKLTKLAKDHSSEEEEEEEDDDIEEKEDDNGDFEDEEVASLHLARHPPELHLPAGVTRGGDGVQQPVVVNAEDVFATYGEIIGLVDDDDDDASLYEPSSSEVGSSAAASSAETSRAPSRLEEGEQEKLLLEAEAGNVDNEEEEEEEEDADIPVSYYNALLLNERYQRALQDLISSAREALEDNLFRQREVTAEIEERNRDGDKAARGTGGGDNISMAKRSLAVFNPPYFKDARGFSHPPNPDTVAKRERQELDVYLSNPREWTSTEKARLKRAVKEDALRERMKSLIEAKDALVEEGKARGASRKSKERIMEQLRDLKARSDEVLSMPDEELFHNREEDFDWMRISVQTVRLQFEGKKEYLRPNKILLVSPVQWLRHAQVLSADVEEPPPPDHQQRDLDEGGGRHAVGPGGRVRRQALGHHRRGAQHREDGVPLLHALPAEEQPRRRQAEVEQGGGRQAQAAGGAVPDQQLRAVVQDILPHEQEDEGAVLPAAPVLATGQPPQGSLHRRGGLHDRRRGQALRGELGEDRSVHPAPDGGPAALPVQRLPQRHVRVLDAEGRLPAARAG